MQASQIMTPDPVCCTPDDTIESVAKVMADCDCGIVPVVDTTDRKRVVGVITDRDIAIRAVAQGKSPSTKVRDVMTDSAHCCGANADIADVQRTMTDRQVRRVVIVDDDEHCVGIVSQADLALAAAHEGSVSDVEVAAVVERISEPRV